MNKMLRYIFTMALSAWLVVAMADLAFAQNFTGTVSPEATMQVLDPDSDIDAPFINEPLVEQAAHPLSDEEVLAQAVAYGEIPNFSAEEISHYTLGKTDVLEITVLRHPEVSGQFIINNEGNIQYEFVGDIRVEGSTKDEAKTIIVERLSTFIISPEVTVKIVGYNSKIVYVIGEVGRPGKIFMRGDTITVREALVQAALPLLSGKIAKTRLITPSDDGHPKTRKVDVNKLLFKGDLRENLVMEPGDTLYIPPTILAKAMRVIQPVAAPISTTATTGRRVMTGF